ncbi:MAG: TetR/AcrR family transcriptional regulator, partial [Pseudomonadota bacterium]
MEALDAQGKQDRLSRDDWIKTGLSMLMDNGVDAVQITVLARKLGVTRGSFYWHFDSRDALLEALIGYWKQQNTNVMVDAVAGAESLDDGILALFSVWVDHNRFDPQLDQAVRDWSRRDTQLSKVIEKEDTARIEAIAAFYERFEYTQTEAFIRARVIYFTQMSYYALDISHKETMEQRMSYLDAYFRCFTGFDLQPGTADRFRRMLLDREQTDE